MEDLPAWVIKTRIYGPLRGPTSSSCGGPNFGNFWCPVVTLVTFSSNIGNFERNPKKTKKSKKKIHKFPKNSKNPKIKINPKKKQNNIKKSR